MKELKKILLYFIFELLFIHCIWGQDIHFSQFSETPIWRNPSLSGIFNGNFRLQSTYRGQWNSVTNAYRSTSLNAEYKLPVGKSDDFITAGLLILYDKAGTIGLSTSTLFPAISYHKSVSSTNNRYLSVGFSGGIVQRKIDLSAITTNSQYDGGGIGEPLLSGQYRYADGSVGLSYHAQIKNIPDNNYFIGLAYHHFNKPNNSFYRNKSIEINPRLVLSAGLKVGINEYTFLSFQADQSKQGNASETAAGVMYGIKLTDDPDNSLYTIAAGAFLRWNDALIPVVKLDYAPFSIAISYDANISKLKPSSYGRGGFELSISFIGASKNN
jgi:type IX secretion system PorP/SprF family membrane protein